jgi:phage gp46-like protein
MTDIALVFDPATLTADMALAGNDLATDDGVMTAVVVSLFSDARAEPGDAIPDGTSDPRGWWADNADPPMGGIPGRRLGSKLWLLRRAKQTTETLTLAKRYAADALQWMLDDGIATAVTVQTWYPRLAWMGFDIAIQLASGQIVNLKVVKP